MHTRAMFRGRTVDGLLIPQERGVWGVCVGYFDTDD